MKNSTKLKIINWVKRVLNYKGPMIIPMKEQINPIVELNYKHTIDGRLRTPKEIIKRAIAHDFADKMMEDNLINLEIQRCADGKIHIYAKALMLNANK